uniref:Uncharacterized protein n=1 Tax=Anguilla anguilla TaxID=7936 RepID=A0A0E9S1Y0_ANGAN
MGGALIWGFCPSGHTVEQCTTHLAAIWPAPTPCTAPYFQAMLVFSPLPLAPPPFHWPNPSVHLLSAWKHRLFQEGEHIQNPRALAPFPFGEVV